MKSEKNIEVNIKSFSNFHPNRIDCALQTSHHQIILIVDAIEVKTQRSSLEFYCTNDLFVQEHFHRVAACQANCNQIVL